MSRVLAALAAAIALLATGCHSPKLRQDLKHHLLLLDAEGQIVDSDGEPERDPRKRVDAMLDAMLAWLRKNGHEKRILIHVHGGLTTTAATIERANRLIPEIKDDPIDAAWPIFVSWPSGGAGSWWEGTWKLRNGKHERFFGPITAPVYLATDLVQGLARAPIDMGYLLKNDVEAASLVALDLPLSDEWTNPVDLVAAMESDPARRDHVSVGTFERGFAAQLGRTATWFATVVPKLVVTPLFLDGLGNTAWRTMRHRAFNSGRPSEEFETAPTGVSAAAVAERLDPTPTGGLALLMGELGRRIRVAKDKTPSTDPDVLALQYSALGSDFDLRLIGHSMGAILLNYVLELQPELPANDIVYMAPACSVAEAARSLVPFLRRANSPAVARPLCTAPNDCDGAHCDACRKKPPRWTNFWLLTLHPIAEAGEAYPEFLDLPARGSLLEWIDDWYTSASHPLDRMFGKWNNAVPALHLFETVNRHFYAKAFGVDHDSLPQRHGDFNDCPFWKREFWRPEGMPWITAPE